MTKYELVKEIKELVNSKVEHEQKVNALQTEVVLDAVLECIRKHTVSDNKLSLTDLGAFSIKVKAQRNGVNPKTGEKIVIPERKAIVFKPSRTFLESLT